MDTMYNNNTVEELRKGIQLGEVYVQTPEIFTIVKIKIYVFISTQVSLLFILEIIFKYKVIEAKLCDDCKTLDTI